MAGLTDITKNGTLYEFMPRSTAGQFSTSTAYAVGDYCYFDGTLYRCTTAHAAGAFVASHFTAVTIDGELKAKESEIENVKSDLSDVGEETGLIHLFTDWANGGWNSSHVWTDSQNRVSFASTVVLTKGSTIKAYVGSDEKVAILKWMSPEYGNYRPALYTGSYETGSEVIWTMDYDCEVSVIVSKSDGTTNFTPEEMLTKVHILTNGVVGQVNNIETSLNSEYVSLPCGWIAGAWQRNNPKPSYDSRTDRGTFAHLLQLKSGTKVSIKAYAGQKYALASWSANWVNVLFTAWYTTDQLIEIAEDTYFTVIVANSNDTSTVDPTTIGIDVSIMYPSVDSALDGIEEAKPMLSVLGEIYTDTPYYDGYSNSNASNSAPATMPYVIDGGGNSHWITSLKMNVATAGTLAIGTVNKADVATDGSYDSSKLTIKTSITVPQPGTYKHIFEEPIFVKDNEYLFIGQPTNTVVFKYGAYGTDKGFWYVSNSTYKYSSNSLGVTVESIEPTKQSIYKDKKISILGDSISTFDGYIPSGNATYYPRDTVTAVTDTWWKKLIDALGLVLDVNNSWSGSMVTTTAGEESAGCMSRCEALGSPDVIIVYMGINDFNTEVALGTYDGTTALPAVTTTFREAYAIMLNKILTKYQTAEVWVCTLPQCERNGETGFPEVNQNGVPITAFNKAIYELADAFGVKVLDHNKSGLTYQNMPTYNPDNLHPNKYGHSLIANNDIRQMDNYVRIRY